MNYSVFFTLVDYKHTKSLKSSIHGHGNTSHITPHKIMASILQSSSIKILPRNKTEERKKRKKSEEINTAKSKYPSSVEGIYKKKPHIHEAHKKNHIQKLLQVAVEINTIHKRYEPRGQTRAVSIVRKMALGS
jgi:hypothetical protein